MNPIFQRFGGQQQPQQTQQNSNPFGNLMGLMSQFQQFKSNFQGDPKQQVKQMLDSGQISQEQLNQIMPIAKQLQNMLH